MGRPANDNDIVEMCRALEARMTEEQRWNVIRHLKGLGWVEPPPAWVYKLAAEEELFKSIPPNGGRDG